MNRRILISCLVLVLVVCLVLSTVSILGTGLYFWKAAKSPDDIFVLESTDPASEIFQLTSEASQPKETPDLQDTSPQLPLGADQSAIEPGIAAQMELIQRQVIQERGLQPNGDFTRVLFSPEQLRQRVLDDFLEDYTKEDAQQDSIVLTAFGLLDPGFDFYTFYVDLLSEQVAGFYDDKTKEMVVVQGESFGGPERLTYAHEYTHALQDQNYGIETGLNYSEDACEHDSERCAAIQALLEGDASLSELNWFLSHATPQDRTDIFAFYENYESPVFDSAPPFMAEDFLFPYEEGLVFVQYLHDRGGWDAVDQAYVDTPTSTEQILHPERYPDDKPISVDLPDLSEILGAGWEEYDQGVMGEWYTFLILAHGRDERAQQPVDDAAEAAKGWGGDSYIVFYNPVEQTTVMVFSILWESTSEAEAFEEVFDTYAQDRFGPAEVEQHNYSSWVDGQDVHTFHIDGAQTTWILTPSAGLAERVWETLQTK
jgi:hypothetical protein